MTNDINSVVVDPPAVSSIVEQVVKEPQVIDAGTGRAPAMLAAIPLPGFRAGWVQVRDVLAGPAVRRS